MGAPSLSWTTDPVRLIQMISPFFFTYRFRKGVERNFTAEKRLGKLHIGLQVIRVMSANVIWMSGASGYRRWRLALSAQAAPFGQLARKHQDCGCQNQNGGKPPEPDIYKLGYFTLARNSEHAYGGGAQ
jgi:hypothetical protein